ncbi:MAG: HK97 family phage prohead protease, partial [Synechococcus elongatus]
MALTRALPTSLNPATYSLTAVIASSAALIDGHQLVIADDLSNIERPDPLPVLTDHDASTSAVVGTATALRAERLENGETGLLATITLLEHPDRDRLWELISSGAISWSVRFVSTDYDDLRDSIVVNRWRLLEVSAVAIPADPNAQTRSAAEQRWAADIVKAVSRARLDQSLADELIRSGATRQQARSRILEELASREAPSVTQIHVTRERQSPIANAVARAFDGQESLAWALRAAGIQGRTPAQVIARAMSTSDLPAALESTGDRILQQRFSAPARGVLRIANIRPLNDYREASTVATGLVGEARPIRQGGEITFSYVEDSLAKYKPQRFGLGLVATPESLSNDDLAGLQQGFAELGDACLSAEVAALVALIEGSANGAPAPDGLALFAPEHLNETTDETGITLPSLGAAIALLRSQATIGGRLLDQEPGLILASPESELPIRQLVADLQVNSRDEFNPWSLEVAIDARLSGSYYYLVARGNLPLELGRLTPAPQLTSEVQFETGFYRAKAEHSFGCCVVDHRPIVRISTAS